MSLRVKLRKCKRDEHLLMRTIHVFEKPANERTKNVKIEIWFIVVCTLIDNEYASLLFSQTMFSLFLNVELLSEFTKVFERKA